MREKLIELVRVPIKIMPDKELSPTITFTMPYAEEVADHLIANGVIVPVRCKECIHWYEREGVCLKIYSDGAVSPYAWQDRNPDDCCSYGERRT